jgi:hypothetical protein
MWSTGENETQVYWSWVCGPQYDVVRNKRETFWTILLHQGTSSRLIPNPYPQTAQLRFVEVTRIPHAGDEFGDHPGDDVLPETLSPNYAWDEAEAAKRYVETLIHRSRRAMSPRAYRQRGGGCCPVCRSGDLDADHVQIDGTAVWQNVRCLACGSRWQDLYKLTGYGELVPGPADEDAGADV